MALKGQTKSDKRVSAKISAFLRKSAPPKCCNSQENRQFYRNLQKSAKKLTAFWCFRTPGAPIRKILVYNGMLPCLVPCWPQIKQICISFRSRSDLVLDADHSLDFLSEICLVLQVCISFCIGWFLMGLMWMGSEGFLLFFSSLFRFLRFSSLFFCFFVVSSFFSYSPRTRANDCNLLGKWGFHSDPVCTDPV